MELKGSKTEQNLLAAFAGESMARNRYEFFASTAKKEGYEMVKGVFEETAANEKEHAERIFKFLSGIGTTAENLTAGANGEHEEWADIYKEMERVAKEEGFTEIAGFFKTVSEVEREHEERYRAVLGLLNEGKMFKADGEVYWKCRNCGYVHKGKEAPELCPVCKHKQAYFERKCENW